jgi:Domain of unknown function (DUF4278)
MQLTYRGIGYTLNAPTVKIDPRPTASIGKYRGASYLIQRHEMTAAPQVTLNLKYRGAYYYPSAACPTAFVWQPT